MSRPQWLQPRIFEGNERIVAGFSTRRGGVSEAPFASLNLGLSTEDDPDAVIENRRRLFAEVGFMPDKLAITGQVHGAEVLAVDAPGLYRGFDALVCDTPGVLLCLSAADCASVLLATPEGDVVGACHAGWRGTVAGIVGRTVEAMVERGARPDRLHAYISPCISRERFEVGSEVAARFAPSFVLQEVGKKPHVDLKAALVAQLKATGLEEDVIEVSPHCTHTETDTFFSHRSENGVTGRMMGFIGVRT